MRGYKYSYSERQALLYQFIKKVGPTPELALEILFGLKTANALVNLKKTGYLKEVTLNNNRFWLDYNYSYFDPLIQETKAWFVVRLEEAGGKYNGEYGISPNGNRFILKITPKYVYMTDEENRKFIAELEDLKKLPLKECLKWAKK